MVYALKRGFCCVQRRENFRHPLAAWWLGKLRAVPAGRGEDNRAALSLMESWLREGMLHVQAPEGDLSGNETGPFLPGFIRMAQRANVPIIPVSIAGSGECLRERRRPRGFRQFVPRRCHVTVHFSPAVAAPPQVGSREDCIVLAAKIRGIIVDSL